jgi:putative IMPACT (imprinted ancient) family translation regulator
VKAYGDTAKAVLAVAAWEELRVWVQAAITVDWAEHRPLTSKLTSMGAKVDSEVFGSGVSLQARVPEGVLGELQIFTADLTRGRSKWMVPNPRD